MRRALLLALLLIPGIPAATAGTADDPEITDAADNQNPGTDITKVWFETTEEGLRFTIEIVEMRGSAAHRFARVGFAMYGQEYRGVIGWDGAGKIRTHAMKGIIETDTPALEKWVDDNLVSIDVQYGEPARLAATIPWGAFDELEPDVTLTNLAASVSLYSPNAERWTRVEYVESERTYTVGPHPGLAAAVPGGSLGITIGSALVLAGAIGGIAWYRARRAPAPTPPPAVASADTATPPPHEEVARIRIDPRRPE